MANPAPSVLDAQLAAVLAACPAAEVDWAADPPEVLRAAYERERALLAEDIAPGCSVTPFHIEHVAGALSPALAEGLLVTPPAAGERGDDAVAYFHGGGWVVGSPHTHLVPVTWIAAATGLRVYSLRYPLAPEQPFPAQRDAGVAAVQALLAHAVHHVPAPHRLFLMGDSAGAAVAFWVDHALSGTVRERIAGLVGFYGGYGLLDSDSLRRLGSPGSGLTRAEVAGMYARLGDRTRLTAKTGFDILETVRGDGPPVFLSAAELDPLLDDSLTLHRRLVALHRPCTLDVAAALPHGHLHYARRVTVVRQAISRMAEWMAGVPASP